MRILFVSPSLGAGAAGTPGVRQLLESCSRVAEVAVVTAAAPGQVEHPRKPPAYELHTAEFGVPGTAARVAGIAKSFRADVVCVRKVPAWRALFEQIRREVPDAKCVLDLASPLDRGTEPSPEQVPTAGARRPQEPDLVLAPRTVGMPRTVVYPPGVQLSRFTPRQVRAGKVACRRFIFDAARCRPAEAAEFLQRFRELPSDIRSAMSLDIRCAPRDRAALAERITGLGLADTPTLLDASPDAELPRILRQYDAAVVWAQGTEDARAALGLLECIAAGIVPIVSSGLVPSAGVDEAFACIGFDATAASFAAAIERAVQQGFPAKHLQRNLALAARHDWHEVIAGHWIPAFRVLAGKAPLPDAPQRATRQREPDGRTPPAARARPLPLERAAQLRSMDRMLLWAPQVEPFSSTAPAQADSLRVGFIGGERLCGGLRDEVELVLLQPETWRASLKYGRLDLLLVESTWTTATCDWYMAQSAMGSARDELEALLRLAKELGIPCAYWMTAAAEYLPLYSEFMRSFDAVFCADPVAVQKLAGQGVQAQLLPPAFQPRHFNPITVLGSLGQVKPGFVYDGWADMFRYGEQSSLLKRLGSENLTIIESSCMMATRQVARTREPALRPAIRGWVPRHLLPEVYKRALGYLSFQQSHATPLQASWALLEAAACRVPVLHHGRLADDDFRSTFAQQREDADDFVAAAQGLAQDGLARERAAQHAWRAAHSAHTYRHRLATMCSALGISRGIPKAAPQATMVTGTMRSHLLAKCIAQYEAQTYPHKELILVFNGAPEQVAGLQAQYAGRADIHVAAIPTDNFAGALLNYGIAHASGDYYFRMDDDDHYGASYVSDCMLHLQAYDAEILGKRASFFHFEGEDAVHLRGDFIPPVSCFSAGRLHESDLTLISGCSFAARMDLLRRVRYPDHVNLSADTELIESIRAQLPDARCLMVDNLNLVVERFSDIGRHTWQEPAGALKQAGRSFCREPSELMV